MNKGYILFRILYDQIIFLRWGLIQIF